MYLLSLGGVQRAVRHNREFVRDLCARGCNLRSASANRTTTAEGVETKEHLERVRAEGCTKVQGYYISRPKPSSDIAALLLAHAEKSGTLCTARTVRNASDAPSPHCGS